MLDWLITIPFYLLASGVIAGFGALVASHHYKKISSRATHRQAVWALVILVAIGFCFNIPAARMERERQRKLAFQVWSPPVPNDGSGVAMAFTAPIHGVYRVVLRDEKALPAPASKQEDIVKGESRTDDGSSEPLFFSEEESFWQRGVAPRRVYCAVLLAHAGTTHRLTVRPSAALASQLTPSARVIVSLMPYSLNDLMFGTMLLSGVGTSFWLVAYGVFVAAAIRLALNRWGLPAPV